MKNQKLISFQNLFSDRTTGRKCNNHVLLSLMGRVGLPQNPSQFSQSDPSPEPQIQSKITEREREMTQKANLFKGQQKRKSIPPSRHGKIPVTRKGSILTSSQSRFLCACICVCVCVQVHISFQFLHEHILLELGK